MCALSGLAFAGQTGQARFALGAVQLLQAIERMGQALYR
jgi:hypothetical protein